MVSYTDQWTLINKPVLNQYARKTISKTINTELPDMSSASFGTQLEDIDLGISPQTGLEDQDDGSRLPLKPELYQALEI